MKRFICMMLSVAAFMSDAVFSASASTTECLEHTAKNGADASSLFAESSGTLEYWMIAAAVAVAAIFYIAIKKRKESKEDKESKDENNPEDE